MHIGRWGHIHVYSDPDIRDAIFPPFARPSMLPLGYITEYSAYKWEGETSCFFFFKPHKKPELVDKSAEYQSWLASVSPSVIVIS